jgi:hypothetical protein
MRSFRLLLAVLLLGLVGSSASGQVVITEIMYHPSSEDRGEEFIEIYNPGPSEVDLSNWCFDGVLLCFQSGDSIAADSYRVVAAAGGGFEAKYLTPPYREWDALTSLDENGERLALFDATPALVDEVTYDDGPPWPVTPDGLGPSLELIDVTRDNDTPRNWHASTAAAGHTVGAPNDVASTPWPPWIEDVEHPADPEPGVPLVVTAKVSDLDVTGVDLVYVIGAERPPTEVDLDVTGVDLVYVIGAERPPTEVTLSMFDDGASNDGAAGDGVWGLPTGGEIPGQPAGTPVRYRLTATGPTGTMEYPRDDDTVEYAGTAVLDPALASDLPIFHWFIDEADYQNCLCEGPVPPECHLTTDETAPALLYFDGKLYDGVEVRVRGASSRTWAKKSWKFFFPQGHNFTAPGLIEIEVDTFNLNSNYADKSYLRETLAWETIRDGDAPALQAFPARLERNGAFFGLYTYLEAPDSDWIRRVGLSTEGARYKAFSEMKLVPSPEELLAEDGNLYEKKNRWDDDPPYQDLFELLVGINQPLLQEGIDFVYDNVDIPGVLNYLALKAILHDNDHIRKNYFLYRDTEGTQRWTMLAWDLDLTLGKNFDGVTVFDDIIWADEDWLPGYPAYISPSHPLFGISAHRKVDDLWNRLIDRVHAIEPLRTMYYRRLRSLMDELLAPGRYEDRLDQLVPRIAPEAALDVLQPWGQQGAAQDVYEAADVIRNEYLAPRRLHLFETHSVCDTEIPCPQPALPPILITEILYAPPGDPEWEFVELYNPSPTKSVDLSGWRLDGLALTFPAGSVILPETYVVVVKNDVAFRARYGGGRYLPAQYKGSLHDLGEPLVLRNQHGGVVSSVRYEAASPWPDVSGGESLELIDLTQATDKVANWEASQSANGTPGTANSGARSLPPIPDLFINEVLVDNQGVNQDNFTEYDPWIEIYNGSDQPVDLSPMYLTDDQGTPQEWSFPSETQICGGCWLLVWADGTDGQGPVPPHTSFELSLTGGFVGLYGSDQTLIDYLVYGPVPADHSYGRFPDGTADTRVFSTVTVAAANEVPTSPLILNEYNAVDSGEFLKNDNRDTYWGRIEGNGGDWFELVVTTNHLDVTGWHLVLTNDTGGAGETTQTLTFDSDLLLQDLRAGTILTVSEELADDDSYDPFGGAATGGSTCRRRTRARASTSRRSRISRCRTSTGS